MRVKLVDKDAPIQPNIMIPIVGGRLHGRHAIADLGGLALRTTESIDGQYYAPMWKDQKATLYPVSWFAGGINQAIMLSEHYGPHMNRWPKFDVIGGYLHGRQKRFSELRGANGYYPLCLPGKCGTIYRFYRATERFVLVPYDWPDDEVPVRAAKVRIGIG